MKLYAYQSLFFTSLHYGAPYLLFGGDETRVPKKQDSDVLLLTGIASPEQMIDDVQPNVKSLKPLTFPDHHAFSPRDIEKINNAFAAMPQESRVILTTEKDAARLRNVSGLSEEVKQRLLVLPVEVKFMLDGEEIFNDKIISYVRKNSRNSILVKRKDDDKPKNSNNPGHRTRTISFRDN